MYYKEEEFWEILYTSLATLRYGSIVSIFFARYDAGAHQIVMREDEISEDDVPQFMKGLRQANNKLLKLKID